jgi:carboxyl-terminal processing protease
LHATKETEVNPKGESKVTRGRYYTAAGRTPQLFGVNANIVVPGRYSQEEIGELFGEYPLESDQLSSRFEDDFSDLSPFQKEHVKEIYRHTRQIKNLSLLPYLPQLQDNSARRLSHNRSHQKLLESLKKDSQIEISEELPSEKTLDIQLEESYLIMKDLILMLWESALIERAS